MKIFVITVLTIVGLISIVETLADSSKVNASQEFCLAQNIFFEAGNQSLEGMAAVADVTLNRVQNSRYPDTICSVVKQGLKYADGTMKRNMCQFSWYCDGKSDKVPSTSDKSWRASLTVANAILNNKHRGITSGSTHYHATYVSPNWVNDIGMKRITQIGAHIFYKFR